MKNSIKKIKTAFLLLLILGTKNIILAQVGMGTINPQKALHISGTTSTTAITGTSVNIVAPTIRVDGLSSASKLTSVSVSDNGDLVLSQALATPLVTIDPINTANSGTDFLTTSVTTTMSATTANTLLKSFSFTLAANSLVRFNASTSFELYTTTVGTVITDTASRLYGTQFQFSAAPTGVTTGANFGSAIYTYSNKVNDALSKGIFYVNSTDNLYLPKGTYTVDLYSYLACSSATYYFSAVQGNGSDTMSIVAFPVQ